MSYAQKNKKRDTRYDSQYKQKNKQKVVKKKKEVSKKKSPNLLERTRANLQREKILKGNVSKKKSNIVSSKPATKKVAPNMKAVSNKVKVTKGMTLSQIAKANNTTVQALKNANNIANVNMIRIGQSIKVPKGVVQSKDPYKKTKPKKNYTVSNDPNSLGKITARIIK